MAREKLKEKLILNPSERKVLLSKIYPVSFCGSIIWLGGELLFGWLFTTFHYLSINYVLILIIMIPVNISLFIISYISAKKRKNVLGTVIFCIFAFTSGIFSVPIIMIIGNFNLYLYGIFSVGLGSMIIVFIISAIMSNKYFSKGYFWHHLILFIIGVFLIELILISALGITSLFTITLSVICLIYTTVAFMLGGAILAKKIKEEYWLFWALNILILLFFYLFIFFLIIILILIFIFLEDVGEVGDVAVSALDPGIVPTEMIEKKKQKIKDNLNEEIKQFEKQ
jgi:hypothetical protein